MWPWTVASLKRTGSITIAVNLSPVRESLLESVSFKRIFKLVPTGTSGATFVRGAGFFNPGLVCALMMAGKIAKADTKISPILKFEFIQSSLGDGVDLIQRESFRMMIAGRGEAIQQSRADLTRSAALDWSTR